MKSKVVYASVCTSTKEMHAPPVYRVMPVLRACMPLCMLMLTGSGMVASDRSACDNPTVLPDGLIAYSMYRCVLVLSVLLCLCESYEYFGIVVLPYAA